jgi:RNA polymerase sigma-70 factor (ECF subfamily)
MSAASDLDLDDRVAASPSDAPRSGTRATTFEAIYEAHAAMVWRALRGLGVREAAIEDAVQEVFLVVHRRKDEFEARSSLRTWVYGIALFVARNARRSERRSNEHEDLNPELVDPAPSPHDEAATAEAMREVAAILEELDEAKREVFVLTELEQLTAVEAADLLGVNVNTVYSRQRGARLAFNAAVGRRRSKEREETR